MSVRFNAAHGGDDYGAPIMKLYLGTYSYEISQTQPNIWQRNGCPYDWKVNQTAYFFDFLRMRKVMGQPGVCVVKGLDTLDEAVAYTTANPIQNPTGWARLFEIWDYYSFGCRFRLGLAD
jgi:hypothetical protein